MHNTLIRSVSLLVIVLAAAEVAFGQQPKAEKGFTPPVRPFDVWSIAFSKDGKIVAASGGMWGDPGEIGVWEFATRQPLARFAEDLGVASVALSPDGKLLASGSWTAVVRVRDWAAAKEIATFDVAGVARVAFSPDGQLLATATEKHTAQLWDIPKRKLLADLDGDLLRFHCVLFSPDGKRVLAGGGDWKRGGTNQVAIWDVSTKKQVMKLVGHENAIICATFSPDAKTIATGGVDTSIRLWDADTGNHLKTMRGHRHWVESLAYTADGKTLVSSSHDARSASGMLNRASKPTRSPACPARSASFISLRITRRCLPADHRRRSRSSTRPAIRNWAFCGVACSPNRPPWRNCRSRSRNQKQEAAFSV